MHGARTYDYASISVGQPNITFIPSESYRVNLELKHKDNKNPGKVGELYE